MGAQFLRVFCKSLVAINKNSLAFLINSGSLPFAFCFSLSSTEFAMLSTACP